jgi:flagellar biosynthesis/type III secretory pathway chaperone
VAKLTELDDLIDEEKRKWKLQNENEKNADILERSKELAQAAIRG